MPEEPLNDRNACLIYIVYHGDMESSTPIAAFHDGEEAERYRGEYEKTLESRCDYAVVRSIPVDAHVGAACIPLYRAYVDVRGESPIYDDDHPYDVIVTSTYSWLAGACGGKPPADRSGTEHWGCWAESDQSIERAVELCRAELKKSHGIEPAGVEHEDEEEAVDGR